jgi:S-adenosylmethionine:tRNA ribosyltransferase-isomerase
MAAAGVMADFELPPGLEAREPPEARGLKRDEVRLLVSDVTADTIEHARFRDLPRWLSPGDMLVVNTSGTLNAALHASTDGGEAFELHLSTRLPGGLWTVEVRRPGPKASVPYGNGRAGTTFRLPAGGRATLLAPYPLVDSLESPSRLWIAALHLPGPVLTYLADHGFPIRYSYVNGSWPNSMYQTVFANEPGSAEMPSAGRPFTAELVTKLVSSGIQIAPLVLHTGVASLENHEPPYEEYYRVPRDTAGRVNVARRAGHRIIAVGTTVVRALETVTDESGTTHPSEGWTSLIVTPDRPPRSVSGLVTGLHEPRATHLMMLGQVRHLERTYAEALGAGYLWHEFGDSHLILGVTGGR